MPPGSYAGALKSGLGYSAGGRATSSGQTSNGPPGQATTLFRVPRAHLPNVVRVYPGDTYVKETLVLEAMKEQLGVSPDRYMRHKSGVIDVQM